MSRELPDGGEVERQQVQSQHAGALLGHEEVCELDELDESLE